MNYFTLFEGETLFYKLCLLLDLRAELDLMSSMYFHYLTFSKNTFKLKIRLWENYATYLNI